MGMRVALALGSGGARGYAHIGALQILEERGHEVVAISGTSMGALVGGITAAGKLSAYTEWALSLTQREVLRLLDPTIASRGTLRLERVIGKVAEILDGARIENGEIPFTAVATDLNNRREVWFQSGPVETAIRASIALPGVIAPVVVDGRLLVDGGLMNPVPIEPTTSTPSDVTVAISLNGPRASAPAQEPPATPVRSWAITDSVKSLTSRLSKRAESEEPEEAEVGIEESVDPEGYSVQAKDIAPSEIFTRSFDAMSAMITRFRMASNPPDVFITVPSDACRTLDFHRAAEMIELGRSLTAEALDSAGY